MISKTSGNNKKTFPVQINDKNVFVNKMAVMFGNNASGKTNLLKAVGFFKKMIVQSPDPKLWHPNFLLSTETSQRNSIFEMIFILNNTQYKYNFSINVKLGVVVEENLYAYYTQKPSHLMERKSQIFEFNEKFKEGESRKQFVLPETLAITKFAQNNGELSKTIVSFFKDKIHVLVSDTSNPMDTYMMFDKYGKEFESMLLDLFKSANTRIDGVFYRKERKALKDLPFAQSALSSNPNLHLTDEIDVVQDGYFHNIYNENKEVVDMTKFNRTQESKGTNKMYDFYGSIYNVIRNDMVLFYDELDVSLHPTFFIETINAFYNDSIGAQLIFNTHNIGSIRKGNNLFNKDQIWFLDKNVYGESSMRSMDEFKNVRGNDYEKLYFEHKYGKLSFIDRISFKSSE